MSFLGDALGVIGRVVGVAVPGVSDAIKTITGAIAKDPAVEKALIDQELEFRKLAFAEAESTRKLYGLEIQSEDKFVRRVRPALVWVVVGILAMNFIIIPFANLFVAAFGGSTIVLVYPDIPDSVLALFGTIFGIYAGARSWDKRTKRSP